MKWERSAFSSATSFHLKIKGVETESFRGNKGSLQGNSVSGYFFKTCTSNTVFDMHFLSLNQRSSTHTAKLRNLVFRKKLFMLTKPILSSKPRKKRTTWLKLNAVFSSRNLQVNEDKTTHITTTWRSKHQNMKGSQDGRFSARKLWGYHSKKTTRNIKYEQTSSSLDQKKSYKWRKSA